MNEKDLGVFIDSLTNYFKQMGAEPDVGVPYIKGDEAVVLDFTGLIGISGARKGCVYVSCPRTMLAKFVEILLDEKDAPEASIRDMAGEMANTIAGNVREKFGSEFMISVPVVISGSPVNVDFPLKVPTYVIPVNWGEYQSFLVVGIQ